MKKLLLTLVSILLTLNLSAQTGGQTVNPDGNDFVKGNTADKLPNVLSANATLPFSESFEDGDYNDWVNNGGTYSVTSTVSQDGTYSLTSSTNGAWKGLTRYFESGSQPQNVSFYIRSGSTSANDAYFTMTGEERTGISSEVFFFYAKGNGKLNMIGSSTDESMSYNADQWYRIEVKNIDWTNKQFDYYVDGSLIQAGMGFRGSAMNECYAIHAFNLTSGVSAYWDNISLDASSPAPSDPTSLTATTVSQSRIDLTWDGTSAKFRVLQKPDSSSADETDGTNIYEGTLKSFNVTGLDTNATYFFTVFGMNDAGTAFSSGSQKASASTLPAADSSQTNAQVGFLAGETDSTYSYDSLGVDIVITTGSSSDGFLELFRINAAPQTGNLPGSAESSGHGSITPSAIYEVHFWQVTNNGLTGMTYEIIISLEGVPGITDPTRLCVFKRSSSGDDWSDAAAGGATIAYNAGMNALIISGLTTFSEFAIGSDGGDNPLPVELFSFTGSATANGVQLNWVTASETDNDGFILLRNGEVIADHTNVSALDGQGTTSGKTAYRYLDQSVELGTYAYTLRSEDISGLIHDYDFSVNVEVKELGDGSPDEISYALSQNYPNPFNPSTTITYAMKKAGVATLKVYDVLGRMVFEQTKASVKGENQINFNGSNLTSGVYYYQLNAEGFSKTMKMMLVK